jgi:hypothetical protein
MMGNIFDRISGKDAVNLIEELNAAREEVYKARKETKMYLANIGARSREQLAWLGTNLEKIEEKYTDLVLSMNEGNFDKTKDQLFSLNDVATIVLSMPIIDSDGKKSSFLEWADSAFESAELSSSIKGRIERALEKPKVPGFSHIKGDFNFKRLVYNPITPSLFKKATGEYEERLQAGIDSAVKRRRNTFRMKAEQEEKILTSRDKDIDAKIDELSESAQFSTVVIRLFEDIRTEDPVTSKKAVESYVPYLINKYGMEETINWFINGRGEEASPALLLLNAQAKTVDPLKSFTDLLPNKMVVTNFLLELSKLTDDKAREYKLKSQAAANTGDNIRVNELSLFIPSQMGFVEESEDGLKMAHFGHKVELPTGEVAIGEFLDYIDATQEDYIRISDTEMGNLGGLNRSYYSKDTKKLNLEYSGRGWNKKFESSEDDVAMEKAYDFLNQYAEDERFVQLNDKTIINKYEVDHAWMSTYEDEGESKYKVSYITNGNTRSIVNITSEENAKDYLDTFSQVDPTGFYLSPKEVAKASTIANSWYNLSDEGVSALKFVVGPKTYMAEMSRSEAKAHQRAFVNNHGHVAIGEETLNPATTPLIYFNEEKSRLCFPVGGRDLYVEMSESEAMSVMRTIENNNPDFVRYKEHGLMNPSLMGRIAYNTEEGKLKYIIGHSHWESSTEPEYAARVLDHASKSGEFVNLISKTLLNMNKAGLFSYNSKEGRLEYSLSGDGEAWTRMGTEKAIAVLDHIETLGKVSASNRLEKEFEGVDKTIELKTVEVADEAPKFDVPEEKFEENYKNFRVDAASEEPTSPPEESAAEEEWVDPFKRAVAPKEEKPAPSDEDPSNDNDKGGDIKPSNPYDFKI